MHLLHRCMLDNRMQTNQRHKGERNKGRWLEVHETQGNQTFAQGRHTRVQLTLQQAQQARARVRRLGDLEFGNHGNGAERLMPGRKVAQLLPQDLLRSSRFVCVCVCVCVWVGGCGCSSLLRAHTQHTERGREMTISASEIKRWRRAWLAATTAFRSSTL